MKYLFTICGFLILTGQINAQIDQSQSVYLDRDYSAKIQKAEKLLKGLVETKNLPGLSVAVGIKNRIIWAQGFGFADLENKTPVRINSKFRIGSISKSLTALAVGKLIESGQLRLSDTVQKYVPYFPTKQHPVTIEDLTSHTAGIRNYNYRNGEYFSDKNYKSIEESINIFKDDPLLFKPGSQFSYTTYGYVLLSAVIEGVTNTNFTEYMRDSIFIPMGLKNTVPDYNRDIILNRVRFYDEADNKIVNSSYVNNSNKWAGGGYLSTPLDLIKMAQILINNEFLNESTVQQLWTPAVLSNGEQTNYGIGWRKDEDNLNRVYVHHGGTSIGGRSFLLIYPKEGFTIAITSNLSTDFDQSFAREIAELFIE